MGRLSKTGKGGWERGFGVWRGLNALGEKDTAAFMHCWNC